MTRDRLQQLRADRTSRRAFVQRALTLGVGLGPLGALLAACGRDAPKGETIRMGAAERLGPIEKELHIYNWSDYIAEDTVANFEREFRVKVTYDTYESNEEMVAKLQAGATGYDLVVPSSYTIPVLTATGMLAPVHRELLTNWGNLSPLFLDLASDHGNEYSVPWLWGTLGIAYRADKVGTPPDSWSVFHDARFRQKLTMMDDGREVIGAMLRYRGHSLNSVNQAELAGAKADAIVAKKYLQAYVSAPVKGQLIAGDVWIAQLWNGDTMQAKKEQASIDYVVPKEGATLWSDSLVIPASAANPRAAHEFMNYILRPEVGAAISTLTGYGTPNAAAAARMPAPVPYPTPAELTRLEYQVDLGEHTELWDRIWSEIKSA